LAVAIFKTEVVRLVELVGLWEVAFTRAQARLPIRVEVVGHHPLPVAAAAAAVPETLPMVEPALAITTMLAVVESVVVVTVALEKLVVAVVVAVAVC
jgi:hypothetical protein